MLIDALRRDGVHAVFHYVPLHSSPGGTGGRPRGRLDGASRSRASERLVRLPLWLGVEPEQDRVIEGVLSALG